MKQFDRDYIRFINAELRPAQEKVGTVLDLFAGCGGLGLGFEAAGFITIGYEMDEDCCASYNRNLGGECKNIYLTPGYKFERADVVVGGPPCQPFSVGGLQLGLNDSRDGFPIFIAAVNQLRPKLWMFENVRGLLYKNKWYLDEVITKLEGFGYIVEYHLLNASHYLVPQNRERVIVVGHKGGFEFPSRAQRTVTVGQALGELVNDAPTDGKYLTPAQDAYVAKYEIASKCINPRDLILSKPARTLTCRNLAGATGDMHRIRLADGRRRRLTVREAARLQSFPDWFHFEGAEASQFKQIGNAVAPMFAYALGRSVSQYLKQESFLSESQIKRKQGPQQSSFSY